MTTQSPDLYTLRLTCPLAQIDALEELFEGEGLAQSILTPPRQETATLEIILDQKPDEAVLRARLAACPAIGARMEVTPVGNLDWIKKVAQDFPPLPIARWTVFGAAHRDKITDFSHALQIDATSAFGTGEHPTTRGCLERLDTLLKEQPSLASGSLLDMGCGSGILAMAFAKAGTASARALGVDMDEPSVAIAQDNAKANAVEGRVRFEVSEGYALPLIAQEAPYDLIMANIFADPLCAMAGELATHLKAGGAAILSGLLVSQSDAVIAAHKAAGLALLDHTKLGEWSVLALRKPA